MTGKGSAMGDSKDSVCLRWLGINGFQFDYAGRTVLLDPYVSRNRDALCLPERVRAHIPKADYVVISHSHWDHLADAHVVAKHTGATIIGSETTVNICASHGIPAEQLVCMAPFKAVECDGFGVTFLPSLHVLPPDGRLPYAGSYTSPPEPPPKTAPEYLEGGTFSVLFEFGRTRVLDIGSANVVEKHLRHLSPSVVIMSTARWENTPRYIERIMGVVSPSLVIPCHHDMMEGPLDQGVTDRDPAATQRFIEKMAAVAPEVKVTPLSYLKPVTLPACR